MGGFSGRAGGESLGELVLDKGNAHLKTVTEMQTFGLIVTAEPYFAVTQPGNMVVLESVLPENVAKGEEIDQPSTSCSGRGTYSASEREAFKAHFWD